MSRTQLQATSLPFTALLAMTKICAQEVMLLPLVCLLLRLMTTYVRLLLTYRLSQVHVQLSGTCASEVPKPCSMYQTRWGTLWLS